MLENIITTLSSFLITRTNDYLLIYYIVNNVTASTFISTDNQTFLYFVSLFNLQARNKEYFGMRLTINNRSREYGKEENGCHVYFTNRLYHFCVWMYGQTRHKGTRAEYGRNFCKNAGKGKSINDSSYTVHMTMYSDGEKTQENEFNITYKKPNMKKTVTKASRKRDFNGFGWKCRMEL